MRELLGQATGVVLLHDENTDEEADELFNRLHVLVLVGYCDQVDGVYRQPSLLLGGISLRDNRPMSKECTLGHYNSIVDAEHQLLVLFTCRKAVHEHFLVQIQSYKLLVYHADYA